MVTRPSVARKATSLFCWLFVLLSLAVTHGIEDDASAGVEHGNLRRQLPGGVEEYFKGGGAAIPLVGVIALVLLFCCLCGGGRWSICDLLACVCLYELCCDDGNPFGGFNLM